MKQFDEENTLLNASMRIDAVIEISTDADCELPDKLKSGSPKYYSGISLTIFANMHL